MQHPQKSNHIINLKLGDMMKILAKFLAASLVLSTVAGCTPPKLPPVNMGLVAQAQILNLKPTEANVFASGQPTKEQIQIVANAGIKHIINLRPASEQDWDEGAYVQSLGMQYHSIPVTDLKGVTSENAKTLDQLLKAIGKEPVLVHCSSGNRVGALIALAEHEINGRDIEAAIAEGRRWGLGGLETGVREKMVTK
jgi:uncharacterized protein (TIGR01244 family)